MVRKVIELFFHTHAPLLAGLKCQPFSSPNKILLENSSYLGPTVSRVWYRKGCIPMFLFNIFLPARTKAISPLFVFIPSYLGEICMCWKQMFQAIWIKTKMRRKRSVSKHKNYLFTLSQLWSLLGQWKWFHFPPHFCWWLQIRVSLGSLDWSQTHNFFFLPSLKLQGRGIMPSMTSFQFWQIPLVNILWRHHQLTPWWLYLDCPLSLGCRWTPASEWLVKLCSSSPSMM